MGLKHAVVFMNRRKFRSLLVMGEVLWELEGPDELKLFERKAKRAFKHFFLIFFYLTLGSVTAMIFVPLFNGKLLFNMFLMCDVSTRFCFSLSFLWQVCFCSSCMLSLWTVESIFYTNILIVHCSLEEVKINLKNLKVYSDNSDKSVTKKLGKIVEKHAFVLR